MRCERGKYIRRAKCEKGNYVNITRENVISVASGGEIERETAHNRVALKLATTQTRAHITQYYKWHGGASRARMVQKPLINGRRYV